MICCIIIRCMPGFEQCKDLRTFIRARSLSLSVRAQPRREFEARQRRRVWINIFCQAKHLESTAQHFRMKQRLQFALGLARIR